jgi:DNA polymerase-1
MIPLHHPWMGGALLVAIGIAKEDGTAKTWVFNHSEAPSINQRQFIEEIQEELDKADRLVGHNIKFDLNWFTYAGLHFKHCKLWCTQVSEYLIRHQKIGHMTLADLSIHYDIPHKIDKVKTFWDAGVETTDIPLNILLPYLERDCLNTLAIYQKQVPKIRELGMDKIAAVQNEGTRALSEMECNGMKVDKPMMEREIKIMQDDLNAIDEELLFQFGHEVHLSSPQKLSAELYGGTIIEEGTKWVTRELKYETKYYERKCKVSREVPGVGFTPFPDTESKKTPGIYSTDKGTIKRLPAKTKKLKAIKKALVSRSKVKKALSTFVGKDGENKGLINKIHPDGCIHGSFNQAITVTGRLSSSNPNLQNLPREGTSPIKRVIVPEFDHIMVADLAQIEWRVAAFLSRDPVMMREVLEGIDCHTDNAIRFFKADPADKNWKNIRTDAKIFVFRMIYGGSAYGFYMDPKMPSYSKKQWFNIVRDFQDKYKGLIAWQEENLRIASQNNGVIISPTGRRFKFDRDVRKGGYKRTQVCNYPVQSVATADIMPLAMVIIYRAMRNAGLRAKCRGQVHDSLIFDTPDNELHKLSRLCINVFEALPKKIEETWGFEFDLPLTGDIEYGPNYGTLKKLQI